MSLSKGRTLRKTSNVSSFLEESTESANSSKTTMNIVAQVHNASDKSRRWDNESDPAAKLSADKEVKQLERSDISASSLRRASKILRDRNFVVSENCFVEPREHLTTESFNLMEHIGARDKSIATLEAKEANSFPEMEPRRRKQWNTATATNEGEDSKKPPRKRWSKNTSVIRLPETSDSFPLLDELHRAVPASRSSVQRNVLLFDNPAFTSENEEILRIETDYKRESTKIEIKPINDCPSVKDTKEAGIEIDGRCLLESDGQGMESHKHFTDSDARSSKTRSSGSKKSHSSPDQTKIANIRSNSITSEKPSTDEKKNEKKLRKMLEETRDQLSKKGEMSLLKEDSQSDEICSSARDVKSTADEEIDTKIKRKKKKKRKQGKREREEEKAETKYISVTIHRTDMLEADYVNTKRPMVKVHIAKARTGDYLRTDRRRNGDTFLQPMITGKFDFKENRSMIPVWEEELIFEHDFNAIIKCEQDSRVIILFEVIDLPSFAEASYSYDRFGREGCWNKIAWAFLKPVGANSTLYIDRKVRLQLYRPKRSFKKYGRHKCEVYSWWQSHNRDKYPSSLFVTVTSVSPSKIEPVLYRQLALNDSSDTRSDTQRLSTRTSDSISLPKWARLAAQSCKIPNEKMFQTEASENGCFYVVFSNDGKYMACVHSEEYDYPIIVYEVENGKIHVRFLGHKVFVYSLSWSNDNHLLLSASADQTARVWDVRNQIVQYVEILPHPSYVYCAKYEPDNVTTVATGCYDHIVRIWMNDKRSQKRELSQELEGHAGFVNSIVFQKNGNLITADSVGAIYVWAIRRNGRIPSKREWSVWRKIKVREIEGTIINTILLHPFESRLLVHSRDDNLRMLDLATGVVLQKYNRLTNQRIQSRACISPCGSLILCGGEDTVLNIWNLETGKLLAKYTNERNYQAVTCVDYHPYDHILAFSIFGSPTPVQVLRFNKDACGNEVGLEIVGNGLPNCNNDSDMNEPSSFPHVRRNMRFSTATTSMQDRIIPTPKEQTRKIHSNFTIRNARRTNHLHHIIEKIDKMLFIIKLKRIQHPIAMDIESGGKNSRTEANCAIEMEEMEGSNEMKFSIVDKGLSFSLESFNLASADTERYRMATLRRPQSAKEFPKDKVINQGQSNILSDNGANFAEYKRRNNPFSTFTTGARGNITGKNIIGRKQDRSSDSSISAIISADGSNILETSQGKSPDSAGTYVIDMTHFEKYIETNKNPSYQFAAAECTGNAKENEVMDFAGISEISNNSLRSDATFIIENETSRPIPKPRYNSLR